jgi:hypothetical protein
MATANTGPGAIAESLSTWHVVQHMQGRVKPTMQLSGQVQVNDDQRLESEAVRMGAKAVQMAKGIQAEGQIR